MKIRATVYSMGGIVLGGILLVFAVLAWIAWQDPHHTAFQLAVFFTLLVASALYYVDAWSESLSLQNGVLVFDSLLRPSRRINVCAMSDVTVVHQGFNQERGIISARFRRPDGNVECLALGPMWSSPQLHDFFSSLEQATGECPLIEES